MKVQEIIAKLDELNLPESQIVLFGSGPLGVLGLREVEDIDLFSTQEVYNSLKEAGWKEDLKLAEDPVLVKDCCEVGAGWKFGNYNPTFEEIYSRGISFGKYRAASLEDVKEWKAAMGREKDMADIKLIESYLEQV